MKSDEGSYSRFELADDPVPGLPNFSRRRNLEVEKTFADRCDIGSIGRCYETDDAEKRGYETREHCEAGWVHQSTHIGDFKALARANSI